MKYFKIFNTRGEYEEYVNSDEFIAPNVSVLSDCSNTWINAERPHPTYSNLVIEGAASISSETCNYNAIVDNTTNVSSSATWSITSGSQYATINSSNGEMTILNTANESTVVIQAVYESLIANKSIVLTYVSGANSETETEFVTDASGNTISTTTTITEYLDGSSIEVAETIVTDSEGDLINSSDSEKQVNADGSYNGKITNYDASGNMTTGSNITGDTAGNVSTQNVEYDESGNTTVIGYNIDTTQTTGKSFNEDGANTDYYAFDATNGFTLDFDFTIDFNNQPSGQDQNHHNILTAKRADPSPWYGFQLRQSGTNRYIQLGTQFSTGNNDNTTINPSSISSGVGSYSLRIIYDPTATASTFVCLDMTNPSLPEEVFRSDDRFPDIPELKYLKVVIGYAVTTNNVPYRYSNINVTKFSLNRLVKIETPVITCINDEVTITCTSPGAIIYYRLNESGNFSAYTNSFYITATTVVEAYVELNGERGDVAKHTCYYDTVEEPVIECNGKFVRITCETDEASIWYRLDETGSYSAYTELIPITATTVVESYASLGSKESEITKETCEYYSIDYFTIRSLSENNNITLRNNMGNNATTSFYSSIDSGFTWASLTIAKGSTVAIATLNSGDTVMLKGSNSTLGTEYQYGHFFRATGNYEIEGNIMSLLTNSRTNMDFETGVKWCFAQMFSGSTNLVNAENLIINPTSMVEGAFNGMFRGCTSLVKAPELPSPYIDAQCYSSMFEGCVALSQPPSVLSATSFANNCYQRMFCMNRTDKVTAAMTYTPKMYGEIGSTTCASQMFCGNGNLETVECYWTNSGGNISQTNWMNNTNSTGTFKKLSSQGFASGANGIPNGWTVINE